MTLRRRLRTASASVPVSGAIGEKPMWPPSSPPYQAVMLFQPRFGTPAWIRSAGCCSVAAVAGSCLAPQTSAPGICSKARLILAKLWSITASSPHSAERMIQRPISSSRAM